VPILFLVASLGVIGSALLEHPRPTLLGFAVTIMGVPVYFAWRRYTRRA
jgi:hypothetical protein